MKKNEHSNTIWLSRLGYRPKGTTISTWHALSRLVSLKHGETTKEAWLTQRHHAGESTEGQRGLRGSVPKLLSLPVEVPAISEEAFDMDLAPGIIWLRDS